MRELIDLPVLEVFPAGEDATKQNCAIYRGNLRVPEALAGVDVGPVIEEPTVIRHLLPEKMQPGEDAIARIFQGNPSPLLADAQGSEPEPGRRDAAKIALVGGSHIEAVSDDTRLRIDL